MQCRISYARRNLIIWGLKLTKALPGSWILAFLLLKQQRYRLSRRMLRQIVPAALIILCQLMFG
jgi:hypothetical protein